MYLVYLWITHVQRVSLLHFHHDASDGPDVDTAIVVLTAEQYFWRSVPKGDHFVGLRSGREAVGPRQPEVREFDGVVLHVDQDVLRLEVAVDDAAFVALVEAD